MAPKLMKRLQLQQCHLLLQIAPFSWQLINHCSIYTTELQAILYALKEAYHCEEVNEFDYLAEVRKSYFEERSLYSLFQKVSPETILTLWENLVYSLKLEVLLSSLCEVKNKNLKIWNSVDC